MKDNGKVVVLASFLLFSSLILGSNSQVIQADGVTDSTSTQTQDDNKVETVEGSNVKTASDGTVSADVNYNGVKYHVEGKIGSTVKATPVDGNGSSIINVKIVDRKMSESIKDSSVQTSINLDGPIGYTVFDDFGQAINGEYESGGQSFTVFQKMIDKNNNVYYRIGDGKWIEQSDSVNLNNDVFSNMQLEDDPYFIVSKSIFDEVTYDDSQADHCSVDADGNVSGTITQHSDKYDKDFDYIYSGKVGEIVDAKLKNNDDQKYNLAPVKIKITQEEALENLPAGSTISLGESGGKYYQLYKDDGSLAGRALLGNSAWQTDRKRIDSNGNVFYRISNTEWIKMVAGVTPNNDDGDSKTTTYIEILKYKEITDNVSINSNLGEQTVKDVTGTIGENIDVPVPEVDGYTSDKTTVSAQVNENGTITTNESVKYTKKNSGSSSSSSSNSSSTATGLVPEYLKQTISTFPDKTNVKLYHLNSNSMTADNERALAPGTDWYSDQRIVVKGNTYYRVATNEWVKANEVYIYTAHTSIVQTKSGDIKNLTSSEGSTVTDRALASNTNWYSDRIGYLDNGATPYYRVATNEFVKQTDANEASK
ncbi:hypothetical protein [Companilactobacillus zhachilii]|uniref:hypothetical protein n=1 Tax=Companilactobacillus zhachilii TaxID=2304606 RepID=UPI004033F6E7